MFYISKKSVVLFLILIPIGITLGWLFDVERKVLIKYDAYLDSKITDRYAFFKKEIEPTLTAYGKKYDLTNNQDISNWKTYENKEYGFSFKYPPEAKIDEESRKRNNYGDGSINLVDISAENYSMAVSAYEYNSNEPVYYGPHHAKRMFESIGKERFGAVNYVEVDGVMGYAGYFCVNPWRMHRYNGEEYVSNFTFYRKGSIICLRAPDWTYWDDIHQRNIVEDLKKGIVSTIRFTK